MSDPSASSHDMPQLAALPPAATLSAAPPILPVASVVPSAWMRWSGRIVFVLAVICAIALLLAWNTQRRLHNLEQELVRRLQDSQTQATEARLLARQAQDQSREAGARATLLETRLAEVALQRSQIEDLIKTLNVSRDENLVVDIEATLRVALQQAALTGSAEPLVVALQLADDRLARARQPRLDNVRRALAKDLDRVKGTRVADLSSLTIRLDDAIRVVDEVPLINQPDDNTRSATGSRTPRAPVPASSQTAPADAASAPSRWGWQLLDWSRGAARVAWDETRSLVRLTRIAQPESMLISPEQSFFLRENLKLRLLNARLALLSRQIPVAEADLHTALQTLPRYFDMKSRKTLQLQATLAEVAAQSTQTVVPRPDDTLAALGAIAGGR